jgi:putative redox protein
MPPIPPIVADLTWLGDLKFSATIDHSSITFDSSGAAGPSPMQALAASLAGCMAMDVALVLTRGRHPLRGLRAHLVAFRAAEDPKRVVSVELRYAVEGAVPAAAIERAIALSREKYCSVWHSLRQDIELRVTFDLVSPTPA